MNHSPRTGGRFRLALLAPVGLALTLALAGCSDGDAEDDAAASLALVEQGVTQMQQGEDEQAEKAFERALRLDAEQLLAHYNRGVLDQRANRDDDARKHFEDALEVEPEHAPSLYNLAILTESDDLDEAIEGYRRAIKVQPDSAAAHMRLGFALNHLGRTSEAEAMLAKGLQLDPSMADVEAPAYD